MKKNLSRSLFCLLVFVCGSGAHLEAQDLHLVWADEFDGSSIDPSIWQYESGPSNDNVQYYTDRTENASLVDGKLRIVALKESYQGFEYTSAHIRTEKARSWRYGRMEASIKLPSSPGFVPAFWMLPLDDQYGWWPNSGEIDIMEHPTNELTTIYGTVHTGNYNLFEGPLPPQGNTTDIPDAESVFHLYAIEWSPESIKFFVDDQMYYAFQNDDGSSDTWPFNQPFYIILNLAVGGGWVGTPNESTVFPAIMEVDYVRVYQALDDLEIQGSEFITYNTENVSYSLGEIEGATYQWRVPGGAEIISGQGSSEITVNWGLFGGDIAAEITSGEVTYLKNLPVRVSSNLIKNMGFEKGVKHWRSASGYPVKAQITLDEKEFYGGGHSVSAGVTDPSGNAWDVQLSQGDIALKGGTKYHASFMAKSGTTQDQISAAVINSSNYALAGQTTVTLGESWDLYEFDFTPSASMTAAFNVDMGGHTGLYHLDDFELTTQELKELNLVKNPDFFDDMEAWSLTTHSAAIAEGTVTKGEYAVSISNGGSDPWDLHLGQSGIPVEHGFEYIVSFDAYAETPRQISALVGKNAEPWTVYSDEQAISLTTSKERYSFTFDMNDPGDPKSRLGFDIGGDPTPVYFDNILLRKGEAIPAPSTLTQARTQSSTSLSAYPNPFQNETSFYYILQQPAQVSLKILSLAGQEVETVESGFRQKGEHVVRWEAGDLPPGIYLYQLSVDKHPEIRKLILYRHHK